MGSGPSVVLAELYGMHAGDGTLYKTTTGVVWELRGNIDEKEFYDFYVVQLLQRLGFETTGHYRSGGKNGCYGVRCCKKAFRNLLLDGGFTIGRKTTTVRAPESVLNGTLRIKAAFLAGLYATDGCFRAGKYPQLQFACASETLIADVDRLLNELVIRSHRWIYRPKKGAIMYFLRVHGTEKVQRFYEAVGFSNPKHFRRAYPFLKH